MLFFHTKVCWLSKSIILNRICDLKEEMYKMFSCDLFDIFEIFVKF